jgi:hypothetical protein
MSNSLLYHAFGLRGYDYVKTEYQAGGVIFTLCQRPRTYRFPVCHSRDVHPRGHRGGVSRPCPSVTSPLPWSCLSGASNARGI